MIITELQSAIDGWLKELDNYSFEKLLVQPSPGSWSLGQLYVHLIDANNYFIKQIKVCLTTNENSAGEAKQEARSMFNNNGFPDELLPGPPSNARTTQPINKEYIINGLTQIREEIGRIGVLITYSKSTGKSKHFALGFFTPMEWLRFAEMHMRHHLRQKKRIDEFLRKTSM